MTFVVEVVVATHRGYVRHRNEDAAGVAGWLLTGERAATIALTIEVAASTELIVADGLGGHVGGARASSTAVGAFFAAIGGLNERIMAADDALHAVGVSDPRLSGLATTLAGVQLHPDGRVTVFNVGDSRVYRLVSGMLGLLTEDDAHADGQLTQVLGGDMRMVIEPHIFETNLGEDVLLVCSDGLTSALDEDMITTALELPLRPAAEAMVNRVLSSGGPDNVTVVLCKRME